MRTRMVQPVGLSKIAAELQSSPSPSGRRWPEGPDEGRQNERFSAFPPSPGASRHPLPEGEGLASERTSKLKASFLGVLCAISVLFAACSHPTASDRTFTLGITSGAQEFVDFVMEGHGLLDQAGLKADK